MGSEVIADMPMIAFRVDEATHKKLQQLADEMEDRLIRGASGAAKVIVQMYLEGKWEG